MHSDEKIRPKEIENAVRRGVGCETVRLIEQTLSKVLASSASRLLGVQGEPAITQLTPKMRRSRKIEREIIHQNLAARIVTAPGLPSTTSTLITAVGIGGTYAFSSNLLLDANIGYLRQGVSAKNTDLGTDWGTSYFNIPGTNGPCSLCGGMPGFFINSLSNLGNQNRSNPFQRRRATHSQTDHSQSGKDWREGHGQT